MCVCVCVCFIKTPISSYFTGIHLCARQPPTTFLLSPIKDLHFYSYPLVVCQHEYKKARMRVHTHTHPHRFRRYGETFKQQVCTLCVCLWHAQSPKMNEITWDSDQSCQSLRLYRCRHSHSRYHFPRSRRIIQRLLFGIDFMTGPTMAFSEC